MREGEGKKNEVFGKGVARFLWEHVLREGKEKRRQFYCRLFVWVVILVYSGSCENNLPENRGSECGL